MRNTFQEKYDVIQEENYKSLIFVSYLRLSPCSRIQTKEIVRSFTLLLINDNNDR
jgi:hypothetical protein